MLASGVELSSSKIDKIIEYVINETIDVLADNYKTLKNVLFKTFKNIIDAEIEEA